MSAIIRKDERAVSPVIATILMVAITVVLAAVLYVMVSGLITGPGAQKPLVTFSGVTKVNAVTWTFTVASAQPAVAQSNYKLNFGIGTNTGAAVNMGLSNANVTVTVATTPSATAVGVKWTDLGGTGQVKGGDIFTIGFPSAPAAGTTLTFYLLYSDGSQIQSRQWQG
jgi:flagellin-like protein